MLFEMDGLCVKCVRCGARWLAIRENAPLPYGLLDFERSTGRRVALSEKVAGNSEVFRRFPDMPSGDRSRISLVK